MANTATYVSTAQPATTGALYVAALNTTLPTDATTKLGTDFTCLGYITEDGITISTDIESGTIKAWGGDTVVAYQKSKSETMKVGLMETRNSAVLGLVYGSDNVTESSGAITIKSDTGELDDMVYVAEMINSDGSLRRIVVPRGKITGLGDQTFVSDSAVVYDLTVSVMKNGTNPLHYEYIGAATTTST